MIKVMWGMNLGNKPFIKRIASESNGKKYDRLTFQGRPFWRTVHITEVFDSGSSIVSYNNVVCSNGKNL